MNNKFTYRLRLILISLSLIILTTEIIILNILQNNDPRLIALHHESIRNTLYIASFIYFILAVIAYFNLPIYFRRSLLRVKSILRDIQQGIYDTEINMEEEKEILDPAIYELMLQVNEMKETVKIFDNLKREKIFEQYSRIKTILRIIQDGALILDNKGKIIFINDNLTETFPLLVEGENFLEKSYPEEIEQNLKKLALTSLRERKRLESVQCLIPSLNRHITIVSALVRNESGDIIGMALIVSNLEKKKIESKPEKGTEIIETGINK